MTGPHGGQGQLNCGALAAERDSKNWSHNTLQGHQEHTYSLALPPKVPTTSNRPPSKSLICEPCSNNYSNYNTSHSGLSLSPSSFSNNFLFFFFQGILDIIVLSKGYTKNDAAIHTLKNNFEADAYFVKVIGEYFRCYQSSFPLSFPFLSLPFYSFPGTSAHSCVMHVKPSRSGSELQQNIVLAIHRPHSDRPAVPTMTLFPCWFSILPRICWIFHIFPDFLNLGHFFSHFLFLSSLVLKNLNFILLDNPHYLTQVTCFWQNSTAGNCRAEVLHFQVIGPGGT